MEKSGEKIHNYISQNLQIFSESKKSQKGRGISAGIKNIIMH